MTNENQENSRGDESEELFGFQYLTNPLSKLIKSPQYSDDAMRTITKVASMSTQELIELGTVMRNYKGDI